MTKKNTLEFVAGENSSSLIRQLAKDLKISEEEVMQKGLLFMKLYAGLQKSKRGRILLETDGETQEITL